MERKNIAFSVMLPSKGRNRRMRKKSFTEAVKEKYCMSDPNKIYTSGFVIDIKVTGKPKTSDSEAELAYLRNVVWYSFFIDGYVKNYVVYQNSKTADLILAAGQLIDNARKFRYHVYRVEIDAMCSHSSQQVHNVMMHEEL